MGRSSAILAIDPGPIRSAWVLYASGDEWISAAELMDNEDMLQFLRVNARSYDSIVIEKIESFGMAVGADVFETVYWSGRFAEAAAPIPVERIGRRLVKLHLCGSARAKDANIRQALLDRFPEGKGTKKHPGPLYSISGDLWSALAVAVTWADTHVEVAA